MAILTGLSWVTRNSAALLDISQGAFTGLGLLAVLFLLLLSAFFASAEIAIFSLGDHRLNSLVDDGIAGAKTLSVLKDDPRRLLVTILVGNNIANIGMSAITTGLLGLYFTPGQSVVIATFGVTSLVLLFGETTPKAYGVEHSEDWSLRVARPLRLVQFGLYPLVELFDILTTIVNKVLGSSGDFESAYVTRAEVEEVITAGQRAGVVTDAEHEMLQRLLRFRNRIAKEAMIPRLDVVAVDVDADIETAIEECLRHDYTRLPVYEDVLDSVVGMVTLPALVQASRADKQQSLRAISTDPYVVPETKDVDELLTELRAERRRMAVVVDEFGTTAGIVTIEDIVEEIIGEMLTETEAPPLRRLEDGTVLVRGELNIHVANEALNTSFPDTGEFESIAGLFMNQTGRLVEEGEAVTYDGARLIAETIENNRILEVRIEQPSAGPDS